MRLRAPAPPVKLTPPRPNSPSWVSKRLAGVICHPEPSTSAPECWYQAQGLAIRIKPWPASPKRSCSMLRRSPVIRSAVVGESP